jgi:ATPase subunit of ABC transporter with duplicated ATPase domains
VLVASNITMQFGAKPLFENVSIKFGDGNRYGLIGANGAGKSTFMKILAGQLDPSSGNVSLDAHERMAFLRQDQFGYEEVRVLDVVMMGHEQMWAAMQERDAIYANPEATEDDYMKAADLEHHFGECGGYTAEARAGELLLGVGIPTEQHNGPMREVAPRHAGPADPRRRACDDRDLVVEAPAHAVASAMCWSMRALSFWTSARSDSSTK